MRSIATIFFCVLLSAVIGCNPTAESTTELAGPDQAQLISVTIQLNWFPEAEHGGYYAAAVHGYFADEGLDVNLIPGGPGVPVVQSVAAGRVDFAVTNADRVLFGHDAGAKVVALMAPIQNTPRCIMVHRESGITRLSELRDVTLAIGTGPAFYQYMQKHLPLENVETIAYPGSIGPFLANPRFAQQAYVFSEPHVAQKQGADPVALMVSEIGYNPYASTLIAMDAQIKADPALVRSIVKASIRGWEHYLKDSTETNKHIASLNPDMDEAALAFGAERLKPLCEVEGVPVGSMLQSRWQTLIDQLAEIELVDPMKVKAADVFDDRFASE